MRSVINDIWNVHCIFCFKFFILHIV